MVFFIFMVILGLMKLIWFSDFKDYWERSGLRWWLILSGWFEGVMKKGIYEDVGYLLFYFLLCLWIFLLLCLLFCVLFYLLFYWIVEGVFCFFLFFDLLLCCSIILNVEDYVGFGVDGDGYVGGGVSVGGGSGSFGLWSECLRWKLSR